MNDRTQTPAAPQSGSTADETTVNMPVNPDHNPALDPAAPDVIYCANHPDRETLLRCNRCGKPICLKCAVLTDVGYRCKECIRGVQAGYFTAAPSDNVIGFGTAAVVTAFASPIAGFIFAFVPFFWGVILAFMIGGGAGSALAQIIRRAVGKRRGRYLRYFALAGIIFGVLVGGVGGLFFGIPILNISTLVFTVLTAAAAYQILR
jgi:hypothetical protein